MNLGPLAKGRHGVKRCSPQVVGHSQKVDMSSSLDTRIVRKLYPKDPKHIYNQLWCDRNVRTSNASEKERYWMINPVHVGVKLLDKHKSTSDRDVTQWLPSPTVNDNGKVSVGEVRRRSKWMPRREKFSKNVMWASSSLQKPKKERSRIRRRKGTRMKRVLSWSGFTLRCHRHN